MASAKEKVATAVVELQALFGNDFGNMSQDIRFLFGKYVFELKDDSNALLHTDPNFGTSEAGKLITRFQLDEVSTISLNSALAVIDNNKLNSKGAVEVLERINDIQAINRANEIAAAAAA